MSKENAAARRAHRREDETAELFDVPATVLCARCGQPDCAGCAPGNEGDSGVVTIVPWERPAGSAWARLWSTASATTLGADTFFASLPDGEISPAVRFAILAETLAIVSMMTVLAPLALVLLPNLALDIIADPSARAAALRWTAIGVPALALWMVAAHAAHGALLDVGARSQGARAQQRRAFRFGLYACGWDLMAGPLGAVVTLFTSGREATKRLAGLSMTAPGRASIAYLRGVYGLTKEETASARRYGTGAAIALTILSGAVFIVLLAIVFGS